MAFHNELTGADLHGTNVKGTPTNPTGLITPGATGEVLAAEDTNVLYRATGLLSSSWVVAGGGGTGGTPGAQGPTGATGPTGPTGATSTVAGPAGAVGATGGTGPQGPAGPGTGTVTGLTGDIQAGGSGIVGSTIVSVGGAGATDIATVTSLGLGATSNNVASTIVLRDGSGNFSASNVTVSSVLSPSILALPTPGSNLLVEATTGTGLGQDGGVLSLFAGNSVTGTGGNVNIASGSGMTSGSIILNGPVKIPGGAVSGYVFTSDASGLASWQSTAATIPAGVVWSYAGSVAPGGWLMCDGSTLSAVAYAALYSVIGTSFGNSGGAGTFDLPNTARRVIVGAGGASGSVLNNVVGSVGGEESHALTVQEMPPHSHMTVGGSGTSIQPGTGIAVNVAADNVALDGFTGGTGGDGLFTPGTVVPHNNIQPSLVMNYIIKY